MSDCNCGECNAERNAARPEDGGHQFMTAAECGCDNQHCPICVGGLAYCKVCKGAEGLLPTECPGVPMTEDQEEGIYTRGDLDFRGGKWINPKNGGAA